MKRSIILALALCATVNIQTFGGKYLFVNATGHLLKGYKVEIKGPQGNMLKTLENGTSAYIPEYSSYQLVAFNDKHEKGNPRNFTPNMDEQKNVIVVKFGKVLNRIHIHQTTLEKAKKEYGHRIQFPA